MKTVKALNLIFCCLSVVVATGFSFASNAEVLNELESLGSNRKVTEKAYLLEERTRIGIVQGRAVDRNLRPELGVSFGPTAYGDSYVTTQNFAVRGDFHINPKWSLGVQYTRNTNSLTNEGQRRFDQARQDLQSKGDFSVPQVSYPEESYLALLNWYMIYGKINLFDIKTVQFDVYSLAGFGQVKVSTEARGETQSENNPMWTAGMGMGFWLSQRFSARIEGRYQNYSDLLVTGSRSLNQVIATIGFGVLL